MSLILPYKTTIPTLHETAFVANGVVITGDVEIGEESSLWYGCVVRGDVNVVRIGKRTNIQDGTVIHVTRGEGQGNIGADKGQGTYIGDDVTIGHMALLHDCTIEDFGFVGMKACVMDKAKIESEGMLAAGAVLTPGKTVPSGQLWGGSPARYMRDLKPEERKFFKISSDNYVRLSREYLEQDGA